MTETPEYEIPETKTSAIPGDVTGSNEPRLVNADEEQSAKDIKAAEEQLNGEGEDGSEDK